MLHRQLVDEYYNANEDEEGEEKDMVMVVMIVTMMVLAIKTIQDLTCGLHRCSWDTQQFRRLYLGVPSHILKAIILHELIFGKNLQNFSNTEFCNKSVFQK